MSWYDYVPLASNISGLAKGNLTQAALGPTGYLLNNAASKGYDTAAKGAGAASAGYADLGNWNWNTAQQGLGAAQDAYNPSQSTWNRTYGSQGPSALDSWYQQNQSQFGGPTSTQGAADQFNRYMSGGTSTNNAYQNGKGLLNTASTAGDYNNQFGGQMTGRSSSAEQAYNPYNYSQPGAAEGFYGQAQGMLGGSGRTGNLSYVGTNDMSNFAGGLAGQQGTGATTQAAGEIGNYYRGANDTSQYAGQQMGQLSGPGAYENFVSGDINGTNPQIQRETDQGLARINQEMARRGGFKSGAADTSIGNFLGEEAAKDYQNRAERAQSAQGMQLNRIGAGQSLSQASDQSQLAQGSALQGLSGQVDAEKMSRLGMQMGAQQGASSEGLANSAQRLNYAQAGDQETLARANALGGFANNAQNQQLNRLAGNMTASGQSDQGYMNRMNAGFNMQQGADQSNLARAMGIFGMAQGNDTMNMNQYGMMGQLAGQNDQMNLSRLLGAGGMAGNVSQMDQNQLNDMFRSRFGLDQANASNIGNFYGMGMQGYDTAMGNSYNALANMYGLQGQGQNAQAALPFQIANTGVNIYKAGQGGG